MNEKDRETKKYVLCVLMGVYGIGAMWLAGSIARDISSGTHEPARVVSDGIGQEQIDAVQGLVLLKGYRCDEVVAITRFSFATGYTLSCDGYRYEYELEDHGGFWTVSVL